VQGPSLKGQADIDWTNPEARQRFLAEIVADAEQLLDLVRGTRSDLTKDSPEDHELVAAAGTLARILAQDFERDENGPRLKRGVAADRLISVHDPEMRHGRKSRSYRFDGHKAQVAVDTDSQLITAVVVLPGNAPDAEQALEVVEASEATTDCQVEEVLGDCAYGAGETRAEFAATGRTIVAKVPEIHNQELSPRLRFRSIWRLRRAPAQTDRRPLICDRPKVAVACSCLRPRRARRAQLRPQCTRSRHGRSVQLNPHEALLQHAPRGARASDSPFRRRPARR
jgi:hypothetical protein